MKTAVDFAVEQINPFAAVAFVARLRADVVAGLQVAVGKRDHVAGSPRMTDIEVKMAADFAHY